jgi:hypothetical protein
MDGEKAHEVRRREQRMLPPPCTIAFCTSLLLTLVLW